MTWRYEDGGPRRTQTVGGGLRIGPGEHLEVTTRTAPATTMVVGREEGELFLLRHTAGDGAIAQVERIDPRTLEPLAQSPELPGGPVWPGGLGAHDNGSLHVVFGNHAHRLDTDLRVLASRTLPRERPYNSFVPLPDGHLVTKDFAGSRPAVAVAPGDREPCELVVLEPDGLEIVARLILPEPSIARLSADGDDVYVVGDTSLMRVRWDGSALTLDDSFRAVYRTLDGQTYGWDCVIAAGAAWFLDDGDGSERFNGTLRGNGVSTCPLHLVRVDLVTGEVAMVEVSGLPGGSDRQPARRRRAPRRRGRVRQRQRCGRRLRPRHAHPAGAATRITPAICCSTKTPARSSRATTPTSSSSTSRPAASSPGPTAAAASSACCSRRRASNETSTSARCSP